MNERVRTFFAVALPEEARRAAAQLAGRLRESERGEGVRWVRPEGYHLTLHFLGGVIAYADRVKAALLGVPEPILREHGAVSEPVALAMAEGVRERFGADLAVSTTGIAGPGGGSDAKPVGMVWVGFSDAGESTAQVFEFPLDRSRHRMATAQVALDWVRRALLGEERVALRYLRRPR